MKTLIAILTVAVALLALALWNRNTSARTSLEAADAALTAASNQLAEASMKVTHQEQLATVAKAGLEERARTLAAMSNTVSTLQSDLDRTRVEAVAARASARDSEARGAAAEAQSAGLTSKMEELTVQIRSLKVEIEQARNNAAQLESARFALANEAECVKIEKLELARQWNDPRALRLQLRRLQARAQPLELHANSSVGLSPIPVRGSADPSSPPHH
jgi:predicted RNase H-like nuclease (RuvC/YqgF family)